MKRAVLTLTSVVLACGVVYGQQQPGPNYEHLKCYEQLIGTWVYDGPLQEDVPGFVKDSKFLLSSSLQWILNKNAVEMSWSAKLGDAEFAGKALVGWDTAEERIIEGGMDSVGGHGLGVTTYDQATKTWTTKSKGVDEQGRTTSATAVLKLIDADTYVWQLKDRQGGDLTGDSPKFTVKRVKQSK